MKTKRLDFYFIYQLLHFFNLTLMMKQEKKRLSLLESLDILDTAPEKEFDDITRLAAIICNTPISYISFIDKNRQWFKSSYGLSLLETPRDISFCTYAIQNPDKLMEVKDTRKDRRFKDSPLVKLEPQLNFYASVPLVSTDGYPLGTVCVADNQPRELSYDQKEALMALSRITVHLICNRHLKNLNLQPS